jgi:hypothetical protein
LRGARFDREPGRRPARDRLAEEPAAVGEVEVRLRDGVRPSNRDRDAEDGGYLGRDAGHRAAAVGVDVERAAVGGRKREADRRRVVGRDASRRERLFDGQALVERGRPAGKQELVGEEPRADDGGPEQEDRPLEAHGEGGQHDGGRSDRPGTARGVHTAVEVGGMIESFPPRCEAEPL